MKLLNKFFIPLMAAGILASCTSDNLDGPAVPGQGSENGEGVYMALDIQLPSANGTRSNTTNGGYGTSNDGYEVGKDHENTVDEVLIILADKNNGLITAGTVKGNTLTALADKSYSAVAKFQKSNIADYYGEDGVLTTDEQNINIFVFCNPTSHLKYHFSGKDASSDEANDGITAAQYGDKSWLDLVCEPTRSDNNATDIWNENKFLMNNVKIAKRKLPASLDDWDLYDSEAKAFNLSAINAPGQPAEVDNSENANGGPVEVERSMARFDFKDGSPNNNTYDVIYGVEKSDVEGGEDTKISFIQVELGKMALTNMAKKFYYLPRVSDTGTPSGANFLYCGSEYSNNTKSNYVVGPNWSAFSRTLTSDFNNYFHYPFYTTDGVVDNNAASSDRWASYLISDVLKKDKDNLNQDYHIWTYATENVIPAPVSNQTYDRTTIVVFKGKLKATDDAVNADEKKYPGWSEVAKCINGEGINGDPNQDPIIYQFGSALYKTWNGVRNAVVRECVKFKADGNGIESINRNTALYAAVYGDGGMGTFAYEGKSYTDKEPVKQGCADAAWNAWNAEGKPASGELLKNMKEKVTGAGFTIYQSSKDDKLGGAGYYCYYYYKNYHNDNSKPGVMGPMEFSVVRNNVYKLSVTSISKLGHPRIAENDPDHPDPGTPDESDDIYLTVTCKVVPWIVRINNINF